MNMENNSGILIKDFIQSNINRETELENTIDDLQKQIRDLKAVIEKSDVCDKKTAIPVGDNYAEHLLHRLLAQSEVTLSNDNYGTDVRLSIRDYLLSEQEFAYISAILNSVTNLTIDEYIKSTSSITPLSITECSGPIGVNTSTSLIADHTGRIYNVAY